MNPAIGPDVAGDDQHSSFHRDAGAGRGVAPHDDRPRTNRGGHRIARIAVDHDGAITHALAGSPAGSAVDDHGRAVVQAGDVVADAPLDRHANLFGQGHAQVVARGRAKQTDLGRSRGDGRANRLVDRADRQIAAVDCYHVMSRNRRSS